MGVIETAAMLARVVAQCREGSATKMANIHCDELCEPLQKLFPWASKEAIQYELLSNGLFQPFEWQQAERLLRTPEIWRVVEQEYEHLRNLWYGPDRPIYILPITKGAPKKNGVAYANGLFLFVSEALQVDELRALLAHEYNHVCRLYYLKCQSNQLTLQDSLVIEGLAECAVEELYGEEWLSPWTKYYTMEQVLPIWQAHFVPALQLLDIEKHQPYLFGNHEKLPSWIGYCIGYRLVKSFQQKQGLLSADLLHLPTQTIIEGSAFNRL